VAVFLSSVFTVVRVFRVLQPKSGLAGLGGAEYLLDQHWSAKIEYQFVDLGTETVRITAPPCVGSGCAPPANVSSFNAAFRDSFNVVRLGLNYRF
jgi:opacity protein-like surface antigen